MSETQLLRTNQVRTDGGTQMRAALNEEMIAELTVAVRNGVAIPEAVVFFDGVHYWLADGFHRWHAHHRAERSMRCQVRQGTQRDAILYAAGANQTHGLRRSAIDKRIAIETLLHDAEWSQRSDRWIADQVGVSHNTVSATRSETTTSSGGQLTTSETEGEKPTQPEANGEVAETNGEATRTDRRGRKQPARKKRVKKLCERCSKHGPARDCVYCDELNPKKEKRKKKPKAGDVTPTVTLLTDHLGHLVADMNLCAKHFLLDPPGKPIHGDIGYQGARRKIKELWKELESWFKLNTKKLKEKEKASNGQS